MSLLPRVSLPDHIAIVIINLVDSDLTHDFFYAVFSGVHFLLLGLTIILWGVFPRWMGYIIVFAGPCMIANSVFYIIWPGYDGDLTLLLDLPALIAEFWLCGWLLVNVPHPAKNREFFPKTAVDEPAPEEPQK